MAETNQLKGQLCPFCNKKELTLSETEQEIPFFGKIHIFSMDCSNCKYHKSDIEADKEHEPAKYTLEINSKEDLNIRVIKSSEATVKIPHIGSITPGPASNGYITNVEGILKRIKEQIENLKETAEEDDEKKKAKNMLKKLNRVFWGSEKIKLTIEDPTGNSAIISEKAVKTKIKK
jgi:zinc finger protein